MPESPDTSAGSPRRKAVHVLFLHGVGRHSRLSSLFRAFQSLRSYVQSPEAPMESEDPFLNWTLEEFDDSSDPVCLKLTQRPGSPGGSDASEVYLYEVNYSAIAGVVRENHQLDLTHLLVSLDLAIAVARTRLAEVIAKPEPQDPPPGELKKHLELALVGQRMAGVFVAATVPVLGLPSLLLRNYLAPFVADFTRFFEDVATFALDRNGEAVISAHVQHTIESITSRLDRDPTRTPADEFVIVAHSLGTVVTHSFLVKNWLSPHIPDRLITLGSPIGTVCWLWRFLDFRALQFNPDPTAKNPLPYFSWKPAAAPSGVGRTMEWTNVVNHLDPIATVFPLSDVFLAMPQSEIAAQLAGGAVRQHYIKTGDLRSVGASHTEYYDDKANFLTLLGKKIGLIGARRADPPSRAPAAHWKEACRDLRTWQWVLNIAGGGVIAGYIYWIASRCHSTMPYALLLLYLFPPLTVGALAFFQRLIRGGPTKRTLVDTIESLTLDHWTLPYLIPRWIPKWMRSGNFKLTKRRPNALENFIWGVISFIPTLVAMILPIVWLEWLHGSKVGVLDFVEAAGFTLSFVFIGIFMLYTVFFAASEIARHWRKGIEAARAIG